VGDALAPLRNAGFRRLAFAYSINQTGNWLGEVALTVLVFDRTGSIMAAAAVFLALELTPAIVGPPLVAKLEQRGSRQAIPLLYLAGAALYATLALVADSAALALVLALVALDGSFGLTGRSLTRAAVVKAVGKQQLREANALFNIAFTATFAAGPALAAVIIALWSPQAALAIDAASFVVAAAVLTSRSLPDVKAKPEALLRRLREAFAYVRARRLLAWALGAQTLAVVFCTWPTPVEIAFIKETLGAGDFAYGTFIAVWGVGTIAGGVVFAAARRVPLLIMLALATVLLGLSFIGFALASTLTFAYLAAAVGGMGNGTQWVAAVTAVQQLAGERFQARIVSLLESLSAVAPGIGFVAGAVTASVFSVRTSFAMAGAGVFVVIVLAALALRGLRAAAVFETGAAQPAFAGEAALAGEAMLAGGTLAPDSAGLVGPATDGDSLGRSAPPITPYPAPCSEPRIVAAIVPYSEDGGNGDKSAEDRIRLAAGNEASATAGGPTKAADANGSDAPRRRSGRFRRRGRFARGGDLSNTDSTTTDVTAP
jgi:MFS family permease